MRFSNRHQQNFFVPRFGCMFLRYALRSELLRRPPPIVLNRASANNIAQLAQAAYRLVP
jgi:hypothetical protein